MPKKTQFIIQVLNEEYHDAKCSLDFKNKFELNVLIIMPKKTQFIIQVLNEEYHDAKCSLDFKNKFELIVAARLSAQCTDKRVNKVTPRLFSVFPDSYSMSSASLSDIERLIRSCGMYKTKSFQLKEMSGILIKKYGGEVPFGMQNLVDLPGIGRKTANLVMAEGFGKPSVIVDTHVSRVTKRLGFHDTENAYKIEIILQKKFPRKLWTALCHRILAHGRKICTSRNPKCRLCRLREICINKIN
jgi:endonuclease-3